jgi:hypothetical protein
MHSSRKSQPANGDEFGEAIERPDDHGIDLAAALGGWAFSDGWIVLGR